MNDDCFVYYHIHDTFGFVILLGYFSIINSIVFVIYIFKKIFL